MTANHLILGGRDWVRRAGVTVTASSAAAGMPAANALDYRPGVPWQAATATAETLTVDFGENVDVDTVVIVGHNGSPDATVAAALAADGDAAFAAPVYSGAAVDLWPPVYGYGEGGFGYHFKGYADPDDLGVYVSASAIQLGAVNRGRYLRMTFNDPSSPIGAMRVGALMAGVGTAFARNFAFGYTIDQVDPSEQTRTDGGGVIVSARAIFPRVTVTFPALSKSEGLTLAQDLGRRVGRQAPIFLALDPAASAATFYRTSIYGVVSQSSGVRFIGPDRATLSLTIDGLL